MGLLIRLLHHAMCMSVHLTQLTDANRGQGVPLTEKLHRGIDLVRPQINTPPCSDKYSVKKRYIP